MIRAWLEKVRQHPILTVVSCVLLLFAILVSGFGRGGISGASTREWNRICPDRSDEYDGVQIGKSRPIRGDEWAVSLPFVLGQCKSEDFFPCNNKHVNNGMDMFIQTPCAPVWDWTVFGQFHNWGFFLFGADHGVAWSWWSRYLLLPLFAFLFFLKWCKDDIVLSAAGAFAVTCGAPTQWWDTTIPYHLLYFFAILVFLRLVLESRHLIAAVIASFALFVSLSSYAFVNYLPFELLLLPPLIVLFVYVCHSADIPSRKGLRFCLVGIAIAGLMLEVAYFISIHKSVLSLIGASAYPGARFIQGGSFKCLCERALLDWVSVGTAYLKPPEKINQCVASEYIGVFLPLVYGLIICAYKRRRCDGYMFSLVLVSFVMLFWASFQWPDWLAKWSGLCSVPPQRATVIAGFVTLVTFIRFAAFSCKEKVISAKAAFVALVLWLTARIVACVNAPHLLEWFRSSNVALAVLEIAILISSVVVWSGLAGQRRLLVGTLIAFSLVTSLCIHPISEGLSPVYDKRLSNEMMRINNEASGRWIANDWVIAQLPIMLGFDTWSGTQTYCDEAFWHVIDSEECFKTVWNRYAHRVIVDLNGRTQPDNRKRGDLIFFSLDELKVRKLGVKYILWKGAPLKLPWLRLRFTLRDSRIYEVKDVGSHYHNRH